MGQSLSQVYIHLIFGTKDSKPYINDEVRPLLESFISVSFTTFKSNILALKSSVDHVHVLFTLPKNETLSKIVEEIKKSSSKFMKQIEFGNSQFNWQTGYAAFSVNFQDLEPVSEYIDSQHEIHRRTEFKEELRILMEKAHMEKFNEKFFWV
jgi:REP element-mobilizing transposase RayT